MEIIDIRFRPATKPFVSIYDNRVFHDLLVRARYEPIVQDLPTIISECKAAGLTGAVVGGRDVESTYGYKVPNEHVAEVCEAGAGFFVGLAGVDPNKGRDAMVELEYAIDKLKLMGLSLDPFMHRRPVNDPIYRPFFVYCESRQLPVMITAGPGGLVPETVMSDCHPDKIDQVAVNFPNLKLVISHAGWPYVLEVIAVCFRHRNVYLDLSGYEQFPGSEAYVRGANGVIRDKVMFASGHPYVPLTRALKVAGELGFTDKARDRFMGLNAYEVFSFAKAREATVGSKRPS